MGGGCKLKGIFGVGENKVRQEEHWACVGEVRRALEQTLRILGKERLSHRQDNVVDCRRSTVERL